VTDGADAERALQSDTTYEQLRSRIESGQLAPGTRIVETDLVSRLGVSRPTMRAAVQRLRADGLLVRRHGAGSRWIVSPLTSADVREIALIMGLLEGAAVRSICRLANAARRRRIAELRELNGQIRRLNTADPPEIGRITELGDRFHRALVDESDLPRLRAYCDSMRVHVRRYVAAYLAHVSHRGSSSSDEHQDIIEAIARGDADGAETAVRANWTHSAERYADAIERVGERGVW
jgi:DNA-binding GntR family transcriptional regulator